MAEEVQRLLNQLLTEVRAAGGTTLRLLERLDDTSDAHHMINEMDSHLSIWEDTIAELLNIGD